MSYKTLEVELENGWVRPAGAEPLPAHAHALLTILTATPSMATSTSAGSLAERVADLAGIGRGQHSDLSTNQDQLDDFGR